MNIINIFLLLCMSSYNTIFSSIENFIKTDFFTSIQQSSSIPSHFKVIYTKSTQWQKLEGLYNDHFKNKTSSKRSLIPPLIHQIWLGPKPLPENHKKLRDSWKKHHPSWKYKLWRDQDVKNFNLINREAFEKTTNYGEKSDILRYEILYHFGGIYADDDFECLQSFDNLHTYCEFYLGVIVNKNNAPALLNGLIGAAPHHPILKRCIELINTPKDNLISYQAIMYRTGPGLLTQAFFSLIDSLIKNPIVAFPPTYFYALPYQERCHVVADKISQRLKPESMALHYWALSWNNGKIG
jgi:inositol phosphorylceramide mannosyltransferase catalytic subunit